jgi:hypothetical protein
MKAQKLRLFLTETMTKTTIHTLGCDKSLLRMGDAPSARMHEHLLHLKAVRHNGERVFSKCISSYVPDGPAHKIDYRPKLIVVKPIFPYTQSSQVKKCIQGVS